MKKTQFKIGLLAACLISVSSVASAQSCGAESDSGTCKCSKKHCDDKGLLEVINNAASNFEARLASMIPDRDRPLVKSKCNCEKCSGASEFATQYTEVVPRSTPHITPPVAQPDVVHPPMPRVVAPPNPIVDPVHVPHLRTNEVVPLPDSRNNPFGDDPTTGILRPVPTRPASYLRSSNKAKVDYDPQASNDQSMRSILIAKPASKKISDSAQRLAKTTSTRRKQPTENEGTPVEQSYFEQSAPEVVPASLSVPVSNLRNLKTDPADQFVNPLRAQ